MMICRASAANWKATAGLPGPCFCLTHSSRINPSSSSAETMSEADDLEMPLSFAMSARDSSRRG